MSQHGMELDADTNNTNCNNNCNNNAVIEYDPPSPLNIKDRFQRACYWYRHNPRLLHSERVNAQALQRQAAEGDAPDEQPWQVMAAESEKWEAWKKLRGMGSLEAMDQFLKCLNRLEPNWTSLVDAEGNPDSPIAKIRSDDSTNAKLEEQFRLGLRWMKHAKVPAFAQLDLYSLARQAIEGDASDSERPWAIMVEHRELWDAWNKLRGTSQRSAMEKFVHFATDIDCNWQHGDVMSTFPVEKLTA